MTKYYILVFALFSTVFSFAQTAFYPTQNVSGIYFGQVVDMDGNEVISSSQTFLQSLPKVYLFNINNGNIEQTDTFSPEDASLTFGSSISIGNGYIIAGDPANDFSSTDSGAAYVYKKNNGHYEFFQKITAPDASTMDNFGSFVKIHNNFLYISATNDSQPGQDPQLESGSVYVYNFNGTQWVFLQKITATVENSRVFKFGSKIETEDNTVIISSYTHFLGYMRLHTYSQQPTNLVFKNETVPLDNADTTTMDFCLSEGLVYAMNSRMNDSGTPFNEVEILQDFNGGWISGGIVAVAASDQIYDTIEVDGNRMFLGSSSYFLAIERKFPVIYYTKTNNIWDYRSQIFGNGPSNDDDNFGSAMVCQGDQLIIGAPDEGESPAYGKAYYVNATTLGNSEFDKTAVSISPNPTNDIIYIQNNGLNKIVKSEIYSITGKLLSTAENVSQLSLENFASGMYLVKLHSDNGTNHTYKIVKK